MSIGTNQASTFRFQPRQAAIGPRDIIARGLQAEQELYGGPGPQTPELPEDMAQIQDVTTELQNQWFEAKNFANTMWHNYRIDVTKPDSRNPLSIQANQAYLKTLAGIQNAGLKLKDYNKRLAVTDKAVAEGQGEYAVDPRQQYYTDPREYFGSTQQYAPATQSNQYQATDKTTPESYRAAQAGINELRQPVEQDAIQADQAGLAGLALQRRNEASQFINSRYERDTRLDLEALRAARAKEDEDLEIFDEVTTFRQGLFNNDPNTISRFKTMIPNLVDLRPIRTGNKTGVVIIRDSGGNVIKEEIVFNKGASQYEGLAQINDYMQKINPTKYKIPSSRLIKYLKQAEANGYKVSDLPDDESGPKFEELMSVFTDEKGRKKKTFLIESLDELANQGELRDPRGNEIINIEEDGDKLFIEVAEKGGYKEVTIDPVKNKKYLEDLLTINSGLLIQSPNTTGYGTNPQIGTMSKEGNIKLNENPAPSEILNAFEEWKRSQESNKLNNR